MVARKLLSAHSGSSAGLLVLGLGNPGAEFEHTRHNVGADTVMLLAARRGERFRVIRGAHARAAEIRVDGVRAVVAFPLTYMNDSGRAAQALVRRYGIEELEHLVVVHDELDLPVGRVKVKVGGGTAGHNGLKSLQHISTTTGTSACASGSESRLVSARVQTTYFAGPVQLNANCLQQLWRPPPMPSR